MTPSVYVKCELRKLTERLDRCEGDRLSDELQRISLIERVRGNLLRIDVNPDSQAEIDSAEETIAAVSEWLEGEV